MSNLKVLRPDHLTPDQLEVWLQLLRASPELDSPFFHPQYMRAVAAVRDDVSIGIVEQDGVPAMFFPFQRGQAGVFRGLGGRLCEFHGVVAHRDMRWCPEALVRGCGLRAWHFDHLVATPKQLRPYQWDESDSPYIDLRDGFESYCAARRRAGSSQVAQALRKARKIHRELGPLRFELHTADEQVLDALLQWKSDQYKRSNKIVLFRYDWIVALLRRIRATAVEGFSGVCSALYAGDRLLAVHLGMRSGHVLHWWFPAYDRRFSRYSPGAVFLVELAQAASRAGIKRIDLGRGDQRYKQSFMSGSMSLGEGMVHSQPAIRALRQKWHHTKQWIRQSPGRSSLEAPLRLFRQAREYLILR